MEYLAVAEQMPRDKNWEELEALAEDAGTKVVWLGRGDIWHFGNATFTARHPGETEAAFGGQSVDKNEESLVLCYQEDDFTGCLLYTSNYRDAHGGFSSVEEIMNVDGIKEGLYNRIRDQIKVK